MSRRSSAPNCPRTRALSPKFGNSKVRSTRVGVEPPIGHLFEIVLRSVLSSEKCRRAARGARGEFDRHGDTRLIWGDIHYSRPDGRGRKDGRSDDPFMRDHEDKLIRRSYWFDLSDRSIRRLVSQPAALRPRIARPTVPSVVGGDRRRSRPSVNFLRPLAPHLHSFKLVFSKWPRVSCESAGPIFLLTQHGSFADAKNERQICMWQE